MLERRPHCRFDLGLRPDVGGQSDPSLRRWSLREIDDGAGCPGPRQLPGDRGAKPARAARHERDAPGQQAGCSRYVAAFA
jgi:hypothetical protein